MGELPTVPPETYEIGEEVARGGIGRVLRAVDASMGRVVAIKELLPGNDGAEARFIREALVTARLEHPSIVPVHEAGRWPSGEPFYTMKLVQGQSLANAILDAKALAQRLALVPRILAVAEAIAYAHAQRVIHRDIKPSNIILGTYGETLVIDWGLAKELGVPEEDPGPSRDQALDAPVGDSTLMGTVMGTLPYMAPEQARGETVDERADVYALGAVLYHTLTGITPYALASASDETATIPPMSLAPESQQRVRDVLDEVRRGNAVPVEERDPHIPADLTAIVRKAMAPDPALRYSSARDLAEDLRRFETGKLVSAQQYSAVMLARRWYARNRAAALVGALALAALVAGGLWALERVVRARGIAEDERAIAVAERGLAEKAQRQAEARAHELTMLNARASLEHDPTASLAWLLQARAAGPADEAEARRIAADAMSRGVARQVWRGHQSTVNALAFSPDGKWLASAGEDRSLRVWPVDGGKTIDLGRRERRVVGMAFADDHTLLVSDESGAWATIDVAAGTTRELGGRDRDVSWRSFTPDGKQAVWARPDFSVHMAPIAGGGPERALVGHTAQVLALAFTPDGQTVATAADDRTVRVWPAGGGPARVITAPEGRLSAVALSPDGKAVAVVGDAVVRLFDVASGTSKQLRQPYAFDLAFTPDGTGLVTIATDGAVRVWNVRAGTARTLVGHEGTVDALAISPDGRFIASGGKDRTIRLWPLAQEQGERILRGLEGGAQRPTFSPDGALLAAAGSDGAIRVWDVASGATRASLTGHTARVSYVAWSPDGKRLVSLSDDRTARSWDLARGQGRVLITSGEQLSRLRLDDRGDALLYTEGAQRLVIYDLAKEAPRCAIQGKELSQAVFSPDGAKVAYADGDEVRLASATDCAGATLYSHDGFVSWLTFSADGRTIASASKDRTAAVWREGAPLLRVRGHELDLYAVALSPDGSVLATTSYDQTARLWSLPSGALMHVLRGHEQVVGSVVFTPDGETLVTSSLDNTIRLWSVASGEGTVLRGHEDMIWGLAMAPDGRTVASASRDGTVRLWPIDATGGVPREPAAFASWLGSVTSARVDAQNRITSPTE